MPRRSRRNAPKHSKRKNAKNRKSSGSSWPINIVIGLLVVVVVGFVYSSIHRLQVNQHAVNLSSQQSIEEYDSINPREVYEKKPYTDVWVEILNGNGVPGVAAEFTEFLRNEGFDVQRTDNADRFTYSHTQVIDRSDSHEKAIAVARALSIDTSRVRTDVDKSLQLDVTVILGDDYKSIPVYDEVKKTEIP